MAQFSMSKNVWMFLFFFIQEYQFRPTFSKNIWEIWWLHKSILKFTDLYQIKLWMSEYVLIVNKKMYCLKKISYADPMYTLCRNLTKKKGWRFMFLLMTQSCLIEQRGSWFLLTTNLVLFIGLNASKIK